MADKQQVAYEQKVTDALKNKEKMDAVFLNLPDSEYVSKRTYLNIPASYLFSTYPDYKPVNLSVLDWPLRDALDSRIIQCSIINPVFSTTFTLIPLDYLKKH